MIRINGGGIPTGLDIGKMEKSPGQPFVEEPDAPGVTSGRLCAHQRFDPGRTGREKEPLQNGKVEAFIFEGKGQVPLKGRMRRMTRGQDAPTAFLYYPVALADG